MFGLFKKKSPVEALYQKREKLLEEAFRLSTVDRARSDQKTAEAEEVLKKIETLEQAQ